MVVICLPAAAETGNEQERTGSPLTCTVHAPHWAMPQPNFGPLTSSTSRNTQRRGISGSTSAVRGRPLTVNLIMKVSFWKSGSFSGIANGLCIIIGSGARAGDFRIALRCGRGNMLAAVQIRPAAVSPSTGKGGIHAEIQAFTAVRRRPRDGPAVFGRGRAAVDLDRVD